MATPARYGSTEGGESLQRGFSLANLTRSAINMMEQRILVENLPRQVVVVGTERRLFCQYHSESEFPTPKQYMSGGRQRRRPPDHLPKGHPIVIENQCYLKNATRKQNTGSCNFRNGDSTIQAESRETKRPSAVLFNLIVDWRGGQKWDEWEFSLP